jgi:hypothetical protein
MRTANRLEGLSRVGAGPKEVLGMLRRYSENNSLSGRNVFIGTGMPNIPEQRKFIEEQVDFVRQQGGNPILMGVGPGTKVKPTTGQNEFLADLSKRKGLSYMGPLVSRFPDITKDPMGLHLRGPQYQQIFKEFSTPSAAPQQAPRSESRDMTSQFIAAVMQAESLGKRYGKSGELLTSPKGAKGEMQVMPGTITDPGFGVRPAKDNSPDEIARVGRDYAAVMLKRYNNDPTVAAIAYNWGPGNADRWLKSGANFNALPKETSNYVSRITGQLGIAPTARVPQTSPKRVETAPSMKKVEREDKPGSTLELASRTAQPQQDQITRADMERMGPGYQAAFAAMALADTRDDDDEYDDDETISERYLARREEEIAREESTLEQEEPARTSPLAGLDLSYQSPFGEEQPVMMAEGGEAKSMLRRMYESAVPAQVRLFAETALMPEDKRAASTITEQDFSPDEQRQILDAIQKARRTRMQERGLADITEAEIRQKARKQVLQKKYTKLSPETMKDLEESYKKRQAEDAYFLSGKGTVFYGDYPNAFTGKVGAPVQNLRDSTLGKEGAIRNTLGRFVYETTPEGKINIKEQYDFADDLVKEMHQRPSSAYEGMSTAQKLNALLMDTLHNPLDKPNELRPNSTFSYGISTLPSRAGSAFIGNKGRPVDVTIDPREIMPGYAGYANGGVVRRAEGSPIGGEVKPRGSTYTYEEYMDSLNPTLRQQAGARLADITTSGLIHMYDAARLAEGALSSKKSAAEKEQKMSAAHKIYLDTFGFKNRRDPITAEYFNPQEQRAIAELIRRKGGDKGSIQYKDYDVSKRVADEQSVLSGQLDPYVSVNKSLGQFNYEYDPKKKAYRITDEYDFNPIREEGRLITSDTMGDYVSSSSGLYNKARIYGGRHMPPGTGRKVDFTVDPVVNVTPLFNSPVKRAEGSPIYGEVADSGPITEDTRAAFRNMKMPDVRDAREALKLLKSIGMGGVSNLESLARGSVAGVPGVVGDVESIFRDDKARRFATSEEVERQYLPKRLTAPTKEAQGFVEIGTAIDPTIALKAAKPTAKAALKALKESGPQVESVLMGKAPAAQPMGIISESRKALMEVPESSLFVSRVDDFVASQKNPVTKQQLLGQMKGKFRDYEVGRVSEALADLPDTARVLPNELLTRVQSSYPTSRLKTYVLEPQKMDRWASQDNVYSDQPVGVVNLRFDTPMDQIYRDAANKDALESLTSLTNSSRFDEVTPERIAELKNIIQGLPSAKSLSKLSSELDLFQEVTKRAKSSSEEIDSAYKAYKYPATKEEWRPAIDEYFKKNPKATFPEAQEYANKAVQEAADKKLRDYDIDIPDKSLDPAEFLKILQTNATNRMKEILEVQRGAFTRLNDNVRPEMETAAKELKKTSLYEGQHTSLTPKGTPIAFSRFVDHTVNLPDKGETKVMHMIELQSDLFDDIFKEGTKSGNRQKDIAEMAKLQSKVDDIVNSDKRIKSAAEKINHIRASFPSTAPTEKSEEITKIIKQNPEIEKELVEYLKLTSREGKLRARSGFGKYNIEEAFPGMEGSPQVLQQMMIKNAIGGAMQRGVNAVTFPGKESAQAQLYEKLYPNLKQVVKDLGPGFDIRQIELYDAFNTPYSHWGVVWDDSTAKKVLNQGIRFNKGGLVDKQDSDNRKFI